MLFNLLFTSLPPFAIGHFDDGGNGGGGDGDGDGDSDGDGDGVSGLRTNSHLTNPGVCWLEDGFV